MKERIPEQNNGDLGLKQAHAITKMPLGSLVDVKNMNLNGVGGKEVRRGYSLLFRLPVNEKTLSLHHYLNGADSEVLTFSDGTIYGWDGAVTPIRTGLNPTARWQFITYNGNVYGVNGVDTSFLYNGTNYTAIGIHPPTAHLTLTVIAGGALVLGDYSYVETFYDPVTGAESEPYSLGTAPSATTAGSNRTIRLTNFQTPLAYEQATERRIYRRAPTETVYTRTVTLPIATVTYDDTGDTSTGVELEFDNGQRDNGNTVPPTSRIIIEYKDRIFYVPEDQPDGIAWSRVNRPYAVPAGNFTPLQRDGYRVLKVDKLGDSLVIHKRNSVWILIGDPEDAEFKRVSDVGTQDVATSAVSESQIFRLTPHGFYYFTPTEFSDSDLRETYVGKDIIDEERFIDWSQTQDVIMTYYRQNRSRHLYAIFPNAGTISSKVLVFDRDLEQWLKYEVGTDIYSVAEYESGAQQFTIFGDGYGGVYKWDQGDADGTDDEADVLNGTSTGGNTNTALNDTNQNWVVDAYKGLRLTLRIGIGQNQVARIISNSATQLVVDPPFITVPDTTTEYSIGAIEWFGEEFWNDEGAPNLWKRMRWIVPYVRQTGNFSIEIGIRRDFKRGIDALNLKNLQLQLINSDALWGFLIWGVDFWSDSASNLRRLRFTGKFHYYALRYSHRRAAERAFWDGFSSVYQVLGDRNK